MPVFWLSGFVVVVVVSSFFFSRPSNLNILLSKNVAVHMPPHEGWMKKSIVLIPLPSLIKKFVRSFVRSLLDLCFHHYYTVILTESHKSCSTVTRFGGQLHRKSTRALKLPLTTGR